MNTIAKPAVVLPGVSTTDQSPGAVLIDRRPDHLGGGVYIGVRKSPDCLLPMPRREYVALDRAGASRLLADLAVLLAEERGEVGAKVEEAPEPWRPKVGEWVRLKVDAGLFGERGDGNGKVVTVLALRDPANYSYPVTTSHPFAVGEESLHTLDEIEPLTDEDFGPFSPRDRVLVIGRSCSGITEGRVGKVATVWFQDSDRAYHTDAGIYDEADKSLVRITD